MGRFERDVMATVDTVSVSVPSIPTEVNCKRQDPFDFTLESMDHRRPKRTKN